MILDNLSNAYISLNLRVGFVLIGFMIFASLNPNHVSLSTGGDRKVKFAVILFSDILKQNAVLLKFAGRHSGLSGTITSGGNFN